MSLISQSPQKTAAAETLTVFLELESAIRRNSVDTVYRRLAESRRAKLR